MKRAWIKCLPFLVAILVLSACGDDKKSAPVTQDPLLTSSPELSSITAEITKRPTDAALYLQRGNALGRIRQDSLAFKDYQKAISLDSTKAEYYSAIADLLFEGKDINGSLEWIQKAIAKDPTDRKAHLKIAKLFLYLQEYPRAFAEINIVLRKNVYDPEAYYLKAMLYKDMKDTAKAISNLQTAIQVAPDYRDAVVELGTIYSAQKNEIALKYFDNAYVMDTTDLFPVFAKGVYYQEHNDYPNAKTAYRTCIVHDRQYTDAYFNMGYILMQEDSTAKAWRQFDMAIKSDPSNPAAYFNRGLCSEIMDSLQNAAADYRLALRIDTGYDAPKKALSRILKK